MKESSEEWSAEIRSHCWIGHIEVRADGTA
jgi:hypothetical protein